MDRTLFAQAAADAFAVLGQEAWITRKETGEPTAVQAQVRVPNLGDHEGVAPKSADSVWVDLPAGVARTGDLLSIVDKLDGVLRCFILTGWPERSSMNLWVRWIGVRLALPANMQGLPHAFPRIQWTGTDWVPRPE